MSPKGQYDIIILDISDPGAESVWQLPEEKVWPCLKRSDFDQTGFGEAAIQRDPKARNLEIRKRVQSDEDPGTQEYRFV